jgi:hypothetical protein
MKRAAAAVVALGLTGAGLGQDSSRLEANREHFRWSPRDAQELDYRRTVRGSDGIATPEKASLIEAIAAQIRPFEADLGIGSERELLRIAGNTRVKLIDLNNDGVAEVIAQANGLKEGCGVTGNCRFWVFQKTPSGFNRLLDTRYGVQVVAVRSDRTNGFNDIVLGTHDSATRRTLFLYRYRDGQYRLGECYAADWCALCDPPLKTPRIARTKCP